MSSQEISGRGGEQRYRHLFEHIPVCIFIADVKVLPPTIAEANRRAGLVYGYANADLVGMPASQLVARAGTPALLTMLQQARQGQTVTAEIVNQHRDGTPFPARMIAAPDPAECERIIITVEDITAEKQRRSEAEAIDAERRRIGHEIHDGVAQSLAGLRFKSAFWASLADTAPPGMSAALIVTLMRSPHIHGQHERVSLTAHGIVIYRSAFRPQPLPDP